MESKFLPEIFLLHAVFFPFLGAKLPLNLKKKVNNKENVLIFEFCFLGSVNLRGFTSTSLLQRLK